MTPQQQKITSLASRVKEEADLLNNQWKDWLEWVNSLPFAVMVELKLSASQISLRRDNRQHWRLYFLCDGREEPIESWSLAHRKFIVEQLPRLEAKMLLELEERQSVLNNK